MEDDVIIRPVGRPRAFDHESAMQFLIEMYYARCEEKQLPMTMAGLNVALNVCEDTFYDYAEGQYDSEINNFSGAIKKAKKKIEADKLENALMGNYSAPVAIFDLKNNHGYKDKQEIHDTRDKAEPFNVINIIASKKPLPIDD